MEGTMNDQHIEKHFIQSMQWDAMGKRIEQNGLTNSDRRNLTVFPGQFKSQWDLYPERVLEVLGMLVAGERNFKDQRVVERVVGRYLQGIDNLIPDDDQLGSWIGNNELATRAVGLLANVYCQGSEKMKEKVSTLLDKKVGFVDNASEDGGRQSRLNLWNYKFDRAQTNDEVGQHWKNLIGEYIRSENGPEALVNLGLINIEELEKKGSLTTRVESMVESLGIPKNMADDLAASWLTLDRELMDWLKNTYGGSDYEDVMRRVITSNLTVLKEIIGKGGIEVAEGLNTQFAITNFGRYSTEILLDQWENRNNLNLDYGVFLGCWADENGGFYSEDAVKMVDGLWKNAKSLGLGLRIVEARGKISSMQRMYDLNRNYGDKHKISYFVIAGHGEKGKVKLGKGGINDSLIEVGDLTGGKSAAEKTRHYYRPNMPVAVRACEGEEMAIAFSQFFRGHGVGAELVSTAGPLRLDRTDDGMLFFEVAIDNFKPGNFRDYFAGRPWEEGKKELIGKLTDARVEKLLEGARENEALKKEMWKYKGQPILLDVLDKYKLEKLWSMLSDKYNGQEIGLVVKGQVSLPNEEVESGQDVVFWESKESYYRENEGVSSIGTMQHGIKMDKQELMSRWVEDLLRVARQCQEGQMTVSDRESYFPLIEVYSGGNQKWVIADKILIDLRDFFIKNSE